MGRIPLLFGLLVAAAGGAALGYVARGRLATPRLASPRDRPALLERALALYERGDLAAAAAAAREVRRSSLWAEDDAEARLLLALSLGDRDLLEDLARTDPDTPAAGRAAWEIASALPPGPERDARLERIRRLHPDAWVLRPRGAR